MSGFSSLGIGASALQAAQRGLELSGQNISNVNTAGYSRQRLDQVASGGSPVPAMYARSTGVGNGVLVLGTDRLRDEFLEARAQQVRGSASSVASTAATLGAIEGVFGEPSDTGLQAQMASFWNSFGDVANDPTSAAPRTQVLEQAAQLAATFGRTSQQLDTQWSGTRQALDATVAQVNSTASDVARLNDAIRSAKVSGASTNELSDQRDQLVLKLGESIGAVGRLNDDGTVTVSVGGSQLVSGSRTSPLRVDGPTVPGQPGQVSVTWASSGTPATVTGGDVQGLTTALTATIPGYRSALDAVAAQLANAVNSQQAAGYDRNGTQGAAIFSGTTAATLTVSMTATNGIAASKAAPPAYDGDNAASMAGHLGDPRGADASYRSLIVGLGVQSQSASRQADIQDVMLKQVDTARLGVSSVSLDEEMTNLMSYQHAYEAAARFVSVIDSTMDSLMNMAR
ncbi:flagellar hook-associated protein FlgK [Pedococcus sp. KACC 23699]|uniref:Flagellar hook-associated protein 1 n=1 Tax=Pedococcus sp. KACC 23699 TaxID=3149228 RepID=A0AAU7K0E4_9MICO